ncbi:type VII secretion-associated protein [Aldersonia sp. NBC_00410]|uniref:type VII secretion-associated protein n=1 Tax=Aldersonia sp. NBC_00410 TaxID=2975954 RepID=UPI00224F43B8|nr:type VII secretion-associated protein [Aldersonia sp. NBC_00410]MCX5043933.1 type VII secretion-associated protein [Aldersonia sp. NBC_00410]
MTVVASLCVGTDAVWARVWRDGVLTDAEGGPRATDAEGGPQATDAEGEGSATADSGATAIGDLVDRLSAARIVACFPSHWAGPRRDRLADLLGGRGAVVAMMPAGVAAAVAVDETGGVARGVRLVVVELERLATTVSYVNPALDGAEVVACEREPTVGADDLRVRDPAEPTPVEPLATIVAMAERVATGRAVDEVVVVADENPAALEPLLAALARSGPRAGRARVLSPREICPPAADHPEGEIQRSRMRPLVLGAVLLGAAAGGGLWWWLGVESLGDEQATASANSVVSSPVPPPAGDVAFENGRVEFVAPPGWTARPVDPQRPGRLELVPADGTPERIIVIQNAIDPGLGYDEVASALADKIAERGTDGPFGDLQRDVVFAGRPGVSYRETPSAASEVRWHVVVEQELQVSIGCQNPIDGWQVIEPVCEKVVRSLVITPDG